MSMHWGMTVSVGGGTGELVARLSYRQCEYQGLCAARGRGRRTFDVDRVSRRSCAEGAAGADEEDLRGFVSCMTQFVQMPVLA